MSELTPPNYTDLDFDNLVLDAPAIVNRSPYSGGRKVIGGPGREVWRGTATINALSTEDEERPWRAFLYGLRGPVNWFKWMLPCNRHIGPMPTVGAGATDGYELPLTGIQPNARILKAGAFMTVPLPSGRFRAVSLLQDLRGNGDGEATAVFEPALTEAPTQGVTVETANPFIPMSLVQGPQGFAISGGVSGTSLDVEEAR